MESAYNPSAYNTALNNILQGLQVELEAQTVRPIDLLVIGGERLTEAAAWQIGQFAIASNSKFLHVGMDAAHPCTTFEANALNLTYFATDGEEEGFAALNGMVWKRDPKARPKLVFGKRRRLEIRIRKNGTVGVFQGSGRYHQSGFTFAEETIRRKIANLAPSGCAQVIMGNTAVACDIATMGRLARWK